MTTWTDRAGLAVAKVVVFGDRFNAHLYRGDHDTWWNLQHWLAWRRIRAARRERAGAATNQRERPPTSEAWWRSA